MCNRPRVSAALVSGATGQYDETFTLSPTRSCMISFGAASCSLMTSSYRCHCLVSVLPICIGIICSLARPVLDLSLDTYLYHHSQLPCTISASSISSALAAPVLLSSISCLNNREAFWLIHSIAWSNELDLTGESTTEPYFWHNH